MIVHDLMIRIRTKLKDMQKKTYSDWEIIDGINSAAKTLFTVFSRRAINIGAKTKNVCIKKNPIQLPDDFISIKDIRDKDNARLRPVTGNITRLGEYRIIGNTLDAASGSYTMDYYYIPQSIMSVNDELNISIALESPIINIAVESVKGNVEATLSIAMLTADDLASRESSHFRVPGPVEIFGGKL